MKMCFIYVWKNRVFFSEISQKKKRLCFVYLIWTALQGLVLKKKVSQWKKQKRKGNRRSPSRKLARVEKGKKDPRWVPFHCLKIYKGLTYTTWKDSLDFFTAPNSFHFPEQLMNCWYRYTCLDFWFHPVLLGTFWSSCSCYDLLMFWSETF